MWFRFNGGQRVSYPGRVDHAFRSSRGARRVHDEQRMTERQLLKLQLRKLVALATTRRQEIIYKYAEKEKPDRNESEIATIYGEESKSYPFQLLSLNISVWL